MERTPERTHGRDPRLAGLGSRAVYDVGMSRHTEDGHRYRRARIAFLRANPVCWICHHRGADTIDHDPPQAVRRTRMDLSTWRPAHGVHGCDQCPRRADGRPRRCNQERGTRPVQSMGVRYVPTFEW